MAGSSSWADKAEREDAERKKIKELCKMEEWKEVAYLKDRCQNALKNIGQGHEAAILIQQQQMARAQKLRKLLEENHHIEAKRWRAALQEEKQRRKQYQELERIAKKRLKVRKSTACWERSLARFAALSVGVRLKEPKMVQFRHRERIVLPEPSDYRHTFLHSSLLVCKDERSLQPNHRELDAWEAADLQREIMEQCRLVQNEIKNVTNKRQALRGKAALSRNLINQRIHELEEKLLSVSRNKHERQRQLACNGHKGADFSFEAATVNNQCLTTSPLQITSAENGNLTEMNLTNQTWKNHEAVNLLGLEINDDHGNDYPELNDALQTEIDLTQTEAEKNGRDFRHVTAHTANKSCAPEPDASRKIQKRPLTVSKASRSDWQQTRPVVPSSNDICESTKAEDVFVNKLREDANSDTKLSRFTVNTRMPKNDLQNKKEELEVVQVGREKNHEQIFSNTNICDSEHTKQQRRWGKIFKHSRKSQEGEMLGKNHFGMACLSLPGESLENKHVHQQPGSTLEHSTIKSESFDDSKKGSNVSCAESTKLVAKKPGGLEMAELRINQVEECKEEPGKFGMVHCPLIKAKVSAGAQKNVGNIKVKKKMKLKMKDDYFRMLFKEKSTCKNDGMLICGNPDQAVLNDAVLISKSDNAVDRNMSVTLDNDFNKQKNQALSLSSGAPNGMSDKMSLEAANISLQRAHWSTYQSRLQNPVCEKQKRRKSRGTTAKEFGKSDILSKIRPQICNEKLGLVGMCRPLSEQAAIKKSKSHLSLKSKSGQDHGQLENTGNIDLDTCMTGLGNITPGLKDDSKHAFGSTELSCKTNADQRATLSVSKDTKKCKPSIFLEESISVHQNTGSDIDKEPVVKSGGCNAQTNVTCNPSLLPMDKDEILGSARISSLQKEESLSDPGSRRMERITSKALNEDKISYQNIRKEWVGQGSQMTTAQIVAKKLIDYMKEGNHSKQTIKSNLHYASNNSIEQLKADFKLKLDQILKSRNIEHADRSISNRLEQMPEPLDTGDILLQTKSLPSLAFQDSEDPGISPNNSGSLEEQLKADFKEQLTEIIESINIEHTNNNIFTIIRQILASSDRTVFDLSKCSLPRVELEDLVASNTKKDETEGVGKNISRPEAKLIGSFLASLCTGVSQLDDSLCKRTSSDHSLRSSGDDQRSAVQLASTNGRKNYDLDSRMSNSGYEHDYTTVNQCHKLHPDKSVLEIANNSNPDVSEMDEKSRTLLSLERPAKQESFEGNDCLAFKKQGPSHDNLSASSEQSELNDNLSYASEHVQSTKDLPGTSENLNGNEDLKMSRDFRSQSDDFKMFGGQSAEYRIDLENAYTCLSRSSISSMDISYVSLQNKNKGSATAETHCRTEGRLKPRVLFPADQSKEEKCITTYSASLRSSASLSSADLHEETDHRSSIDMLNAATERHNKNELAQRLVSSYAGSTDSLDSNTGNSSFEDWPCSVIRVQQFDPIHESSNDPKPSVSDLGPDGSWHSGFNGASQSYRKCSRELNVDQLDVFPKTVQGPLQNDKCTHRKSEICSCLTENTSNWRSGLLVDSNELINLEEEDGYSIELSPWSMDDFIGMSPRKQDEYYKERADHNCASQEKKRDSDDSLLDVPNRCSVHQNLLNMNSGNSSSKKVEAQRQGNGTKKLR